MELEVSKSNEEDVINSETFHLMQSSGYVLQSTLQANLSHDIHPMGGVLARPLSSPLTHLTSRLKVAPHNSNTVHWPMDDIVELYMETD